MSQGNSSLKGENPNKSHCRKDVHNSYFLSVFSEIFDSLFIVEFLC